MRTAEQFRRRFWSLVTIIGPTDCWVWSKSRPGVVGQVTWPVAMSSIRKTGLVAPARAAWMLTHGRDPGHMFVLHTCVGNPACCNPSHLFLGSADDMVRDTMAKGRTKVRADPPRITIDIESRKDTCALAPG